jgi:hypothetical protein
MFHKILKRHGLALARAGNEENHETRARKLLDKHLDNASVIEHLLTMGVLRDFYIVDVTAAELGDSIAEMVTTACASKYGPCISLSKVHDKTPVLAWSSYTMVKTRDDIIARAIDWLKATTTHKLMTLEDFVEVLEDIDERA